MYTQFLPTITSQSPHYYARLLSLSQQYIIIIRTNDSAASIFRVSYFLKIEAAHFIEDFV
jgi:hypothetical protein